MKLLSAVKPTEKEFEYFGNKLIVPVNAKWIATDADGTVNVFLLEQTPEFSGNIWQCGPRIGCLEVAEVYRNGVKAEDTLVKIN